MSKEREISRRQFLQFATLLPVSELLRKLEQQTTLRRGAPNLVYTEPHFGSKVNNKLESNQLISYLRKVDGDWHRWTDRPFKSKHELGISTNQWLNVDNGFVWSGFTYAIEYSKPLPTAPKLHVLGCLSKMEQITVSRESGPTRLLSDSTQEGLDSLLGQDIWLGIPR